MRCAAFSTCAAIPVGVAEILDMAARRGPIIRQRTVPLPALNGQGHGALLRILGVGAKTPDVSFKWMITSTYAKRCTVAAAHLP